MSQQESSPTIWQKYCKNFDIDDYLNHVIPRPRFYILPRPISHFFGYRPPNAKPQSKLAQPFIWLSAMLGGFIGIAIITNVYRALPLLDGHQVPIVIASFGAAAILEYNTIESPLSQPRNFVFGQFLAALIGVAITKGFERLSADRFADLQWLAGALSVGVTSAVMGMTKTVHPPAGATALLAATSADIIVLGWWLLPLVLLGCSLMLSSALIVNNLTRRWPVYWWTAADLSKKSNEKDIEHVKDVEKEAENRSSESDQDTLAKIKTGQTDRTDARSDSETTVWDGDADAHSEKQTRHNRREHQILITPDHIVLPDWLEVDSYEKELLELFQKKLEERRSGQATEP